MAKRVKATVVEPEKTDAIAVRQSHEASTHGPVALDGPMPAFSGAQMTEALGRYREIQQALDQAMPDQIMDLEGRKFRKRQYWRAVAVAFNLLIEEVSEYREVSGQFDDGRDNFGYVVTYRASTPGGRAAVGDGACYAVEKARRFRCPHPEDPNRPSGRTLHFPGDRCPDYDPAHVWRSLPAQATEHNIRSHAHTRAFNRAVSNLVGFGEVSAEEIEREAVDGSDRPSQGRSEAQKGPSERPTERQFSGPVTVSVSDVKAVTGEKNGKKWSRYDVIFSDGRVGSTFSETLASSAEDAKITEREVRPVLEKTAKSGARWDFSGWEGEEKPSSKKPSKGERKTVIGKVTHAERLFKRGDKTVAGLEFEAQLGKRQYVETDDVSLMKAAQDSIDGDGELEVTYVEESVKNGELHGVKRTAVEWAIRR